MATPTTAPAARSSHDRIRLQIVASLTETYNDWVARGASTDFALKMTLNSSTAGKRSVAEFKAAVC